MAKVNALWELQTPFPSFPLNGEGELRVRMQQEKINSTHERQARHLPLWGRQEGVEFCARFLGGR